MKRMNLIVFIFFGIFLGIDGAIQLLLVHQEFAIFATQSSPNTIPSSSNSNPGSDSTSSGSSSSSSNNDSPASSGQSSSGGLSGSGAEESSPAELGGVSQNNNTINQTSIVVDAENTTSSNPN